MTTYLTQTSSYLPGSPIENDAIDRYIGTLEGEPEVREKVLAMNGIVSRHYAQDVHQAATRNVYELAAQAVLSIEIGAADLSPTFLSVGTTYAPLAAPGIASLVHCQLQSDPSCTLLNRPVEISSHAGVCSSSSAALVAAIRAVQCGDHNTALSVGAEHASEILKATVIRPVDDRADHDNVRNSRWFMSVFLRSMLSDGAGAFLLESSPASSGLSLRVDWTHSMSFANQTPLCMQLDNRTGLLSQDISTLSKYLFTCSREFVHAATRQHGNFLDQETVVLPHMSSFFFQRKMEKIISSFSNDPERPPTYWTNLATAGNTGAASIYVMLDEYLRSRCIKDGQRIVLFVPESGQFNFVMLHLTAVRS